MTCDFLFCLAVCVCVFLFSFIGKLNNMIIRANILSDTYGQLKLRIGKWHIKDHKRDKYVNITFRKDPYHEEGAWADLRHE